MFSIKRTSGKVATAGSGGQHSAQGPVQNLALCIHAKGPCEPPAPAKHLVMGRPHASGFGPLKPALAGKPLTQELGEAPQLRDGCPLLPHRVEERREGQQARKRPAACTRTRGRVRLGRGGLWSHAARVQHRRLTLTGTCNVHAGRVQAYRCTKELATCVCVWGGVPAYLHGIFTRDLQTPHACLHTRCRHMDTQAAHTAAA